LFRLREVNWSNFIIIYVRKPDNQSVFFQIIIKPSFSYHQKLGQSRKVFHFCCFWVNFTKHFYDVQMLLDKLRSLRCLWVCLNHILLSLKKLSALLNLQTVLIICGLFICDFKYMRLKLWHFRGMNHPIYICYWSRYMQICYMRTNFLRSLPIAYNEGRLYTLIRFILSQHDRG